MQEANRQWFALGIDGKVYAMGDCGDMDAADEVADDMGVEVVWMADYSTAMQWCDAILGQLERIKL
jgi:hypothetical protein